MPNETPSPTFIRRSIKGRDADVFETTLRVAGTSYSNEDGSSRQRAIAKLTIGDTLTLVRELEYSHHDHDSAIMVFAKDGQIGYIERAVADAMAAEMDLGWDPQGLVVAVPTNMYDIGNVEIQLFEWA